ncbi:MAG: T9SS type A sorting domain-containing protein [Ignavibacteria bacterium]|nr:T9SS type A sorting domain-containing protein [Ignavibacteria bacterium]
MKKFLPVLFLLSATLHAQEIILNEIYNASDQANEWIELLVLSDRLDIRGWDFRDFSTTAAAQPAMIFTSHSLWSNLRAGTIIVITHQSTAFEDLDASDFTLVVRSSNTLLLSGGGFNFASTTDAIHIRKPNGFHVHGISWGTANAASIQAPKVHFTGPSSSNTSISYGGGSAAGLTDPANWTFNNPNSTIGTGNGGANSTWIAGMRARADGSGSATAKPDTLLSGSTFDLRVMFRRDPQFTINGLRLIVPPSFQWSRTASDVTFTNLTSTMSVAGDTITFAPISFSADTTVITVRTISPPESTAYYPVVVQTRGTSQYESIMASPTIVAFGVPVPISEVKTNDPNGVAVRMGQLATVHGIVTVANEFGGPSYISDNSGGMSIFGSSFSTRVNVGDEVIVSGRITQFYGLNQFEFPYLHLVSSSGNDVSPQVIQVRDIKNEGIGGIEQYEGRLVRLSGVAVRTIAGGTVGNWTGDTNYKIIQNGDTAEVRIDKDTNLNGAAAPQGFFDLVGVLGQFKSSSPFIGGYQVMPRSTSDIIASGPIVLTTPKETAISPTSVTIGWKTKNPGTTRARYGRTTNYELGDVTASGTHTDHSITISNLTPASLYYVLPYSVSGVDTSFGSRLLVSTSSATSKGTINVYFNKSIDASVARGEIASGNVPLASRFIERIRSAKYSIDLAIYNMSGTPGSSIATELVGAQTRGVKVRVIGEKDNITNPPFATLRTNGIPVIDDGYDAANGGVGFMHNKFAIFDYADPGSDTSVWVWTGSWNFTYNGTETDFQNAIEFQDRALAGAFTLEFNEMWGSPTPTPDQTKTRFGARKTDNIPHSFVVGGVPVELYFSPSDRTTEQIVNTVNMTKHSANVAMLSFTRSDIANALVARKNAGTKVRVIMDNNTDQSNQFSFLLTNGVNVLLDPFPVQLHHKYLIVDAEHTSYPGVVLTGSHNWSTSAETRNDENTVIIRRNRIANLYLQEFKARYNAAGGLDSIIVAVEKMSDAVPTRFSLSQNYPNPFNPSTTIEFGLPQTTRISLTVFDLVGRGIATLAEGEYQAGVHRVTWNTKNLPSGVYFYRFSGGGIVQLKRMMLVK